MLTYRCLFIIFLMINVSVISVKVIVELLVTITLNSLYWTIYVPATFTCQKHYLLLKGTNVLLFLSQ